MSLPNTFRSDKQADVHRMKRKLAKKNFDTIHCRKNLDRKKVRKQEYRKLPLISSGLIHLHKGF